MDTDAAIANLKAGSKVLTSLKLLNLLAFMWPQSAVVKNGCSYDFIVVGGGTAGCVIASQLAKLNASVLLLEAGQQPQYESMVPGLFLYLKGSQMDWNYTSITDEEMFRYHKNKNAEIEQGKGLGGSSEINFMIYEKGIPEDYDKWVEITNDNSWQMKRLCKYVKKIEQVTDKDILNSPDVKFHGTKGKIKIKKFYSEENANYFGAYEELGHKIVADINPNTTLGYTNAMMNIDCGSRQTSAVAYLSPEIDNPNLSVVYNATVLKVIFDENKNAIGVIYVTEDNTTITVRANKEVILSAGVINSPKILMHSGIGPREHLEENNIIVIEDSPAVGQNFSDHPTTILIYKMGKPKSPIRINPFEFPVAIMNGHVALQEGQRHADYQVLSGVVNEIRFFYQFCGYLFSFENEICDSIGKAGVGRQLHYVTLSMLYPESRGEVTLRDEDPMTNPIINPGYYTNENDVENHAKYVEHYNQVLNTTFYRSVEAELIYPELDACDELEKGCIEYWKCYVKSMSSTLHMYYGTCAMGSVVNSKLSVNGVKKLRVADASVIPSGVGSTIQGTVYMIAHRLVDLLKKEYGLCRN